MVTHLLEARQRKVLETVDRDGVPNTRILGKFFLETLKGDIWKLSQVASRLTSSHTTHGPLSILLKQSF